MDKVVLINSKQGISPMDLNAPSPLGRVSDVVSESASSDLTPNTAFRNFGVVLAGTGGCGINLTRPFANDARLSKVGFFDTSTTNSRVGEMVFLVTDGSGSGSHRAENAREIEKVIPQIDEQYTGTGDVAIVCFSLSGGSGSVLGPLMLREYARKGMRVIAVCVADTSSVIASKNTYNTLKTLASIANNNNLVIPTILLSNDEAESRGRVDTQAMILMDSVIALLTAEVYEVDRNDRLNWVDSRKAVGTGPGLRIIGVSGDDINLDDRIVLGLGSDEIVDSLMILQSSPDDVSDKPLPLARLKKTGYYSVPNGANRLVGWVSSDISSIEKIIDHVEKTQNAAAAQKHASVDRLKTEGSDDLIL